MATTVKKSDQDYRFPKLNIMVFSDYDLLHVVQDHEGERTEAIAEVLEAAPGAVGRRFGWMKRMGLITRNTQKGWVLDRKGKALLLTRGEMILSIRDLARQASKDSVAGWVANREWKRNL